MFKFKKGLKKRKKQPPTLPFPISSPAQLSLPSPRPGQPHQAAGLLRSARFLSAAQLSTSSLSSPTANLAPLVSTIPFLQPSSASHQAAAAGRIPAPLSLPLLQS
jgi:hypothetical protein